MKLLYFKKHKLLNYPSVIIILLLLFLILHPTTLVSTNYFLLKNKIDKFIEETEKQSSIDLEKFWQLRQFSGNGNFVFDRNSIFKNSHSLPFLKFNSSRWSSNEYLLEDYQAKEKFENKKQECTEIIFQSVDEIICKTLDSRFLIFFIKSTDDMLKVNAYLDVKGRDEDLIKGKVWYQESTIL